MKLFTFILISLILLSSTFKGNAWAWIHTPITLYNDTFYTLTNIHADSGYQAYFNSINVTELAADTNTTFYANWQFQDNGYDNDNKAELFFTLNNTNYVLQMVGNYDFADTAMYIRFDPGGESSANQQVFFEKVVHKWVDSGSEDVWVNVPINDGYDLSEGLHLHQSAEIYLSN